MSTRHRELGTVSSKWLVFAIISNLFFFSHGATISAPHMHAYALELLRDQLKPGSHILDVGSGSGYLTACFARFLNGGEPPSPAKGIVVGIEHHPSLVELGIKNVTSDDPALLESGQV